MVVAIFQTVFISFRKRVLYNNAGDYPNSNGEIYGFYLYLIIVYMQPNKSYVNFLGRYDGSLVAHLVSLKQILPVGGQYVGVDEPDSITVMPPSPWFSKSLQLEALVRLTSEDKNLILAQIYKSVTFDCDIVASAWQAYFFCSCRHRCRHRFDGSFLDTFYCRQTLVDNLPENPYSCQYKCSFSS